LSESFIITFDESRAGTPGKIAHHRNLAPMLGVRIVVVKHLLDDIYTL